MLLPPPVSTPTCPLVLFLMSLHYNGTRTAVWSRRTLKNLSETLRINWTFPSLWNLNVTAMLETTVSGQVLGPVGSHLWKDSCLQQRQEPSS